MPQKSIASFFTRPKQTAAKESVESKENEVPSHPPDKEDVDERETKKRRLLKNDNEPHESPPDDQVRVNIPSPCKLSSSASLLSIQNLEDLDDNMETEHK